MKSGRLPALDGLRALSILFVIGFHYEGTHVPGGAIGVQVFFVLSGWLITRLLSSELESRGHIRIGAFYVRRLLRLYPALAAIVIVALVAALIVGPTRNLGWAVPGGLLYLNDVTMALGHSSGWLDPTWSLGVEQQFYLLWPVLLAALLIRLQRPRAGQVLLGAAVLMLIIESITAAQISGAWTYYTPLGSAAGLFMGAAIALLRIRVNALVGLAGVLVLVVLCFVRGTFFDGIAQAGVLAAGVVVAWLVNQPEAPIFASRPAVWLGERSYGVYLVHQAMLIFLVSVLNGPPSWVVLIIGVPASIGVAALSYRYVEQPFLRLKDRRWHSPGESVSAA